MGYPYYCSGCGRQLGTVKDPAQVRGKVFYCREHGPTPPPKQSGEKAEESPKPNKSRSPKENKGK